MSNDEIIVKRKYEAKLRLIRLRMPKVNPHLVFNRDGKQYHTCLECKSLKQALGIVTFRQGKGIPVSKAYPHLKDCKQKGKF
jgi:hypothetical protein